MSDKTKILIIAAVVGYVLWTRASELAAEDEPEPDTDRDAQIAKMMDDGLSYDQAEDQLDGVPEYLQ